MMQGAASTAQTQTTFSLYVNFLINNINASVYAGTGHNLWVNCEFSLEQYKIDLYWFL